MSATTKPFFRCQIVMTPGPSRTVQLHIHRRDGTIQRMPAPAGITLASVNIEATQAAGSDAVVVHVGPH